MGQTVNLLSTTSMVRIHDLPPKNKHREYGACFFAFLQDKKVSSAVFIYPALKVRILS